MTEEKREEIKELAFYQAAFMRLFFIKGEIVKIEAEVTVHDKESPEWNELLKDLDTEAAKDFVSRQLKVEYLKALVEAYKKEADELGKLLKIGEFKPA